MSDEEMIAGSQDNASADGKPACENVCAAENTEVSAPEDPGNPVGDTGAAMLIRMNEHHKPLRTWGFSFIDWYPGMEILDIGCGGGAAMHEMLTLSEGSIVKGIDHSDKSISLSKVLNADAVKYERCRVEKADVHNMPFIDDEFDLVTAIETMYFWNDPLAAMREIRRVLKNGGLFTVMAEACNHDTWAEDRDKFSTPFIVYTAEEITDFMHKAGFTEVKAEHGEDENICVIGVKPKE